MASLGQLVAGVAHEINNPLSYVTNNLVVLDRDLRQVAGLMTLYRDPSSATSVPGRSGRPRSEIDLELHALRTSTGSSRAPVRACSGSARSSEGSATSPGSTRHEQGSSTPTRPSG